MRRYTSGALFGGSVGGPIVRQQRPSHDDADSPGNDEARWIEQEIHVGVEVYGDSRPQDGAQQHQHEFADERTGDDSERGHEPFHVHGDGFESAGESVLQGIY